MENQFRVEVRLDGREALIVVSGELDLASGPELESELLRIARPETERLVIDLRGLEFMDSTGLSILLQAHQRLSADGVAMGLIRGSAQVQRLLDLTGVSERVTFVDQPGELLGGP